jgi:hypothetical protein
MEYERPKAPYCRSVWLNGARTMSIMVVDPVRRPLGCSIPALLLVLLPQRPCTGSLPDRLFRYTDRCFAIKINYVKNHTRS